LFRPQGYITHDIGVVLLKWLWPARAGLVAW